MVCCFAAMQPGQLVYEPKRPAGRPTGKVTSKRRDAESSTYIPETELRIATTWPTIRTAATKPGPSEMRALLDQSFRRTPGSIAVGLMRARPVRADMRQALETAAAELREVNVNAAWTRSPRPSSRLLRRLTRIRGVIGPILTDSASYAAARPRRMARR